MTIQLRTMQPTDLDQGYRLSQQMSWPHRYEDWEQALALGEGIVAENNQGVVGCAMIWSWGEKRSTLGLVIVDPAYQGIGIGRKLMEELLDKVPGGNVRLHATKMGKTLYEKYGFVEQCSVFQHQIMKLPAIRPPELAEGEVIRPLREEDLQALIESDYQSHGLLRPALWHDLFRSADALFVLEKENKAHGYMTLRKFGRGNVLGPLLAQDLCSAQTLFRYAALSLNGQFLRIDTFGNTPFSDWLITQGLPCIDAPLLMVRGTPWQRPAGAMQNYSLMSQAMG